MALLGVGKVALSVSPAERHVPGMTISRWLFVSGPQTASFHKSDAVLLAAFPK